MGRQLTAETKALIKQLLDKGYSRERIKNALHITFDQVEREMKKTGRTARKYEKDHGLAALYARIQRKNGTSPRPEVTPTSDFTKGWTPRMWKGKEGK
jgi:IS30 family transposase